MKKFTNWLAERAKAVAALVTAGGASGLVELGHEVGVNVPTGVALIVISVLTPVIVHAVPNRLKAA